MFMRGATVALIVALSLLLGCGEDPPASTSDDTGAAADTSKLADVPIGPDISVVPPTLKLGTQLLGATIQRSIAVFNTGTADLIVTGIELSAESALTTITFDPTGPFTVEPKDKRVVQLTVTASIGLSDNSPAATLRVSTNIAGQPTVSVPIFLLIQGPELAVSPAQSIDFGLTAKGITVPRAVTVTNVGGGQLTISRVELVDDSGGEFALVDGGFLPASATRTAHPLASGQAGTFTVTFTPHSLGGAAFGELRIFSDDVAKPGWSISLAGARMDTDKCAIELMFAPLHLGYVGWGQSTAIDVQIRNVGAGVCNFKQLVVGPCGVSVTQGQPAAFTCATFGATPFSASGASASLFALTPGQVGTVTVKFDAPTDVPFDVDPNKTLPFAAFLALQFVDQSSGEAVWYAKDPTDKMAIGNYKPNLTATVGKNGVAVLPAALDLGLVTAGCASKVQQVQAYSTGNIPAFITKAELVGCGKDFGKVAWPTIPNSGLEITTSGPQVFHVRYTPQKPGAQQCKLVVTTGVAGVCVDAQGTQVGGSCAVTADCTKGVLCAGDHFTVPLSGAATTVTAVTDEFVLQGGKAVDLLLVVDDSGSMKEAQKNLAEGVKALLNSAAKWGASYHIGVTTTDMKFDVGRLQDISGVRILTASSTPTAAAGLAELVKLGTNGSANEQGLEAAKRAFSLPHVFDTCDSKCVSCVTDKDCPNNMLCVADALGNKACGNNNRGFLRKDAELRVLFVSDEEDSSPAAVSYYTQSLRALKGPHKAGAVQAHAVVGLGTTPQLPGCSAQKGNRYLTVAKQTGGLAADVCAANLGPSLAAIGDQMFGPAHRLPLSMQAQPSTIGVAVDSNPCAGPSSTSWTYDEGSNSVVLVPATGGGTCLAASAGTPGKPVKVQVQYAVVCNAP